MTKRLGVLFAVLGIVAAACAGGTASPSAQVQGASAPATSSAAGASSPAAAGSPVKIGFITKFPVDFYDIMVNAAKEWGKSHPDVQLVFAQGKSGTDDEGETNAIESMISQGVKAIAITPTSPNVSGALDKAIAAGIKVVLVDNDIPDWKGKSAVVATDNLAGGKLAGQWLKDHLKAGAKIGVLKGRLGNPTLEQRVTGMLATLGSAATVVATLPTDCDQTKGLNAAQDILTAHPDVTAIYSACGPPAIGALQALKNANIASGTVTMVGFDASPDEITAILAGQEAASVAQFPAKMGQMGADTAYKAALGQTVPANVDTGTEMVTKDNAAQFK